MMRIQGGRINVFTFVYFGTADGHLSEMTIIYIYHSGVWRLTRRDRRWFWKVGRVREDNALRTEINQKTR